MKLVQDGIKPEDKQLAINVRNYLVSGNRVIGDPGEGLKQTLKKLEEQRDSKIIGKADWFMKDTDLEEQISKTVAGIKGEESLCEYLTRLIKYDDALNGLVAFASLSYQQEDNTLDYIPDTDTLLVYGKHLLVIDAKNIKTKPNKPLMLCSGVVVDDKGKEILEVHPSTHIWERVMKNANIEIESIDGYVCIVNDTETEIIRTEEWYECHTKLIHISELKTILEEWVANKDNTLYLNMLTEIAKAQIKKEKNLSMDLDAIKRKFNV